MTKWLYQSNLVIVHINQLKPINTINSKIPQTQLQMILKSCIYCYNNLFKKLNERKASEYSLVMQAIGTLDSLFILFTSLAKSIETSHNN